MQFRTPELDLDPEVSTTRKMSHSKAEGKALGRGKDLYVVSRPDFTEY